MSMNSGLLSTTVISLLVPHLPAKQCQQYRFRSQSASQVIVASFPSFGLWYCPLKAFGHFFQCRCIQSTHPIQPGNPASSYSVTVLRSSCKFGYLFKYTGPKRLYIAPKNNGKPHAGSPPTCGTCRRAVGTRGPLVDLVRAWPIPSRRREDRFFW